MALQIRSNVPAPQPSMIHRRKKMGWTRPGEGIIARSFREEANRGPAPGGPLRIDVGALSPLPWAWRPCLILNHFLGLFHAMDTTKTYRSARHLFPWGTGQPSSPKDNEPQRSRAVRGQGAAAQTMSRQLEQNDEATTKSFTKDT